jgi:hypothetical protein
MMSAFVRGAGGIQDCVTARWPEWLVQLNVWMFDVNVGAKCEQTARHQFALDVAYAVQVPRDYDKARDLFLIATLDRAEEHDTDGLCQHVIGLLRRRIAGQDVADAMTATFSAAHAAAAHAAAANDAAAHDAAFFAAHAAADSDAYAAALAAVHAAGRAAADSNAATRAAARDGARAARGAVNVALRQNLIAALNAA